MRTKNEKKNQTLTNVLLPVSSFRYLLNFIAAGFVLVGTLFDCGVWYYVKNLKIFDDEVKDKEIDLAEKEEQATTDRPS